MRSFRKIVARLTGFHGFFSGKKPTPGVHVAVIGEGPERSHSYEGGFWGAVRRWWPWEREHDRVGLMTPASDPAEGGRDPGSRFWLGFRWYSDARRGEESEPEDDETVRSLSSLSVGDGGGSSGDGDGEGAQAVSRSRWEQVQHFWASGREESSSQGGSGTEPPDGGGGVAQGTTGEERENASSHEEEGGAGEQSMESVPDRRWLSVGWTPWGAVKKPDAEPRSPLGQAEGGGEEESSPNLGGNGEGKEGEGEGEVLGKVLEGQTALKEPSYLQRWWPASSAQEVEPEVAASAAGSVGEAGPDGGGGAGGEEIGAVVEAQPLPEESGYLKRWWPISPAREMEPEEATSTAGIVGGTVLEEAICVEEEEREEGKEATERGKGQELGAAAETQPSPEESSYLRRWWPSSSAQEVKPGEAAPTTDSVGDAVLDEATATMGEEGEGEREEERGSIGMGIEAIVVAQTPSDEPSYLQRWWPARSVRRVEPEAATPAASGVGETDAKGDEGEEEVAVVAGVDPSDRSELEVEEGVAEEVAVEAGGESSSRKREQSLLRMWWPASKDPSESRQDDVDSGVGDDNEEGCAQKMEHGGVGEEDEEEGGLGREPKEQILEKGGVGGKDEGREIMEQGGLRGKGEEVEKKEETGMGGEEEEEEVEEGEVEGGEEETARNAGIAGEDSANPSGLPPVSRRWPPFLRAWPLETIRSDDAPPLAMCEEWSSSEEERALFQGGTFSGDGGQESFVGEVIVGESLPMLEDGQALAPVGSGKEDELPLEPREDDAPEDKLGEAREGDAKENLELGREGSDEVLDTESHLQVAPAETNTDGVSDNELVGRASDSGGGGRSKAEDKQSAP